MFDHLQGCFLKNARCRASSFDCVGKPRFLYIFVASFSSFNMKRFCLQVKRLFGMYCY